MEMHLIFMVWKGKYCKMTIFLSGPMNSLQSLSKHELLSCRNCQTNQKLILEDSDLNSQNNYENNEQI